MFAAGFLRHGITPAQKAATRQAHTEHDGTGTKETHCCMKHWNSFLEETKREHYVTSQNLRNHQRRQNTKLDVNKEQEGPQSVDGKFTC